MKMKLNSQIVKLLEITSAIMDFGDDTVKELFNKIVKHIEHDPTIKFYIKSVKIKRKKTHIEIVTISTNVISVKTTIRVDLWVTKDFELKHKIEQEVRALESFLEIVEPNNTNTENEQPLNQGGTNHEETRESYERVERRTCKEP